MTYSKWIHFLQMIPKDGSPREVPGDGMCFPHGNLQVIDMISPMLYALLTKGYI